IAPLNYHSLKRLPLPTNLNSFLRARTPYPSLKESSKRSWHGMAEYRYLDSDRGSFPVDNLTEDDVQEIERIHSRWIEFEVAGDYDCLLGLCADDIVLWPPDAEPLRGRAAVSRQMAHGTTKIQCIDITDRQIRGSNNIAYLTANYKTTFFPVENSTPRQDLGSHLWILR